MGMHIHREVWKGFRATKEAEGASAGGTNGTVAHLACCEATSGAGGEQANYGTGYPGVAARGATAGIADEFPKCQRAGGQQPNGMDVFRLCTRTGARVPLYKES